MTYEEKISAINEIVTKLRDTKTGLNSLLNFVFSGIPKTAKPETLHEFILKCAAAQKTNENLDPADDTKFKKIKAQFNMFVIKKIHEYEKNCIFPFVDCINKCQCTNCKDNDKRKGQQA